MTGVRRVFVLPELLLAIKGFALILILLRWYRVLTVEDCQIAPEPPLRRALSSLIPANQPFHMLFGLELDCLSETSIRYNHA